MLHGLPFEPPTTNPTVELDPSLVMGAQHLAPGDDLYPVLRPGEQPGTRIPKGLFTETLIYLI